MSLLLLLGLSTYPFSIQASRQLSACMQLCLLPSSSNSRLTASFSCSLQFPLSLLCLAEPLPLASPSSTFSLPISAVHTVTATVQSSLFLSLFSNISTLGSRHHSTNSASSLQPLVAGVFCSTPSVSVLHVTGWFSCHSSSRSASVTVTTASSFQSRSLLRLWHPRFCPHYFLSQLVEATTGSVFQRSPSTDCCLAVPFFQPSTATASSSGFCVFSPTRYLPSFCPRRRPPSSSAAVHQFVHSSAAVQLPVAASSCFQFATSSAGVVSPSSQLSKLVAEAAVTSSSFRSFSPCTRHLYVFCNSNQLSNAHRRYQFRLSSSCLCFGYHLLC